jgi:hypothetical protein
MRKEFLELWVHDNNELETILHKRIVAREKLHHWPLSYVEKIILEDDTVLIYKSQSLATSVEHEFYRKTEAPFLISPLWINICNGCSMMLLPYIHSLKNGKDSSVDENEFDKDISLISNCIQTIENLPIFWDFSSIERFLTVAKDVGNILDSFPGTMTSEYKKWLIKKAPVCFYNQFIGNVHGDLKEENIFRKDKKILYIIDWQLPMKAPILLENALAFRLAGFNAIERYGEFGRMALIYHLIWYTLAYKKWIPVEFVKDTAIALLKEFNEGIK